MENSFSPPPPSGGLVVTYDVHVRLIGKRVVDFLLVLSESFLLGLYAAEARRAKIDWKSTFCKGVGQFPPNFHVEGDVSHQSFLYG